MQFFRCRFKHGTNANLYYELGARHATCPQSTVLLLASDTRLPFDVSPLQAIPYRINKDETLENIEETHKLLVKRLQEARKPHIDSPVFQLLQDVKTQEIDHSKIDTFRDKVT
jgi:hypothetical protein